MTRLLLILAAFPAGYLAARMLRDAGWSLPATLAALGAGGFLLTLSVTQLQARLARRLARRRRGRR
jgi:hypothetical protein